MPTTPARYLATALAMLAPEVQDWADSDETAFSLLKGAEAWHARGIPPVLFAGFVHNIYAVGR